jgi:phosphate starvation-inducible protein PhoH and related proteins
MSRKVRRRESRIEMDAIVQDFEARQSYKEPKKKLVKPLEAKTEAQAHYMLNIDSNNLTFGVGPAGTGKTYICTRMGAKLLDEKRIERLVVTRPAVEAGGGLGFLPGDINEKFAPYFAPFRDVLEDCFGKSQVEYMIKSGTIDIQPLEYIRGLTFDNAFVILDEAQNTTPTQMKLFLSRIGNHSRVVVNGDITQKDIPGPSGLTDAMARLRELRGVGFVEFDEEDIVRSGICKDIMLRYRD